MTIILVSGLDLLSIIVKLILASITGSLSLFADAWHSIGDFATSIMVLVALLLDKRESRKQAQSESRVRIIRRSSWETRVCTLIGLALLAIAAGLMKKVYSGTTMDVISHPVIASVIVLFLMLLSHIRYKVEKSVGQETNSPALIADAYHSRVDIYILSLVLASFVGELLQLRIDRWVAGFIALMVFFIAVQILVRAMRSMVKLSSETVPEDRSIEDAMVLILKGGYSSCKIFIIRCLGKVVSIDDPEFKKRFLKGSIIAVTLSLIFGWLITGFFIVQPQERAVIERFGKPVNMDKSVGPGLHFDWPYPISKIRRVDVTTIRRLQLGYLTETRGNLILWTNAHYTKEFAVLAGDGSILDFAANLHYQVVDPAKFLYSNNNPQRCLELISNQILRDIAGTRVSFELLTHDRDTAEQLMQRRIQSLVDQHHLGISVIQLCFMDMHPPMDVAPAFEDVVSAQEELETFIEQARGYYKETVPLASAEAYSRVNKATSYKNHKLKKAEGRSAAFNKLSLAFKKYNTVNRYRLRMESVETWLANRNLWIVDNKALNRPMNLFVSPSGKTVSATEFAESASGGDENLEP